MDPETPFVDPTLKELPFVDPETGKRMTFPEIVVACLVEERGRTKDDATKLVAAYPQVIMNGIMGGLAFRATATALEMKESEASSPEPTP